MKLTVNTPSGFEQARAWIIDTLLSEFLGLDYVIKLVEGEELSITVGKRALIMPDTFFARARGDWGGVASCRLNLSQTFSVGELPFEVNTLEPTVPNLMGDQICNLSEDRLRLPIDIFGTAFVFLSRYEEFVDHRRDQHDRYAARYSQVGKPEFLERPIVNELLELLWSGLLYLYPRLERRQRRGQTAVTADIDIPYSPGNVNVRRLVRRIGGDILRRKSLGDVVGTLSSFVATKFGSYGFDPYFPSLEWLMDENERFGQHLTLYFIADQSAGDIDGVYSIDEPVIRTVIERARLAGHDIGLHPSYETYRNPHQLKHERERLNDVIQQVDSTYEITQCRQHFLRWSVSETAKHQAEAGLKIDSTLGFADAAGFRAGVCYEFGMFDLVEQRPLPIRQRPLVAMEVSLFGASYMNVKNHEEALDILERLKQNCLQFDGEFRLLWHNNMLRTKVDRDLYRKIISEGG
ncbi:MAG: polysaccharide deacetylase family protein [Bradymonadia bacterium]